MIHRINCHANIYCRIYIYNFFELYLHWLKPRFSNLSTSVLFYDSQPESQCNENFNLLQPITKQHWNFDWWAFWWLIGIIVIVKGLNFPTTGFLSDRTVLDWRVHFLIGFAGVSRISWAVWLVSYGLASTIRFSIEFAHLLDIQIIKKYILL